MTFVLLGRKSHCGRCRNPWGLVLDGGPIEVGRPGHVTVQQRALCPGWAAGSHDVFGLVQS